jgi:pilus assembly protein CpaB
MRVATMISLGASAVLGVGALFVARVYLPSVAPARAARPQCPAPRPTLPWSWPRRRCPTAPGLEAKHLTVSRLPASAVPEGAFTTVEQVLAVDGGAPVVLTPLGPREFVMPSKISGPGARASVAAMISPGHARLRPARIGRDRRGRPRPAW